MPIIDGVGISSETITKQEYFRAIIKCHLKMTTSIIKRYKNKWVDSSYYYFDLNAGPGIIADQVGSPIIFLEEADRYPKSLFKATFIELEEKNYKLLYSRITPYLLYPNFLFEVRHGDNKEILPEYFPVNSKRRMGLIYSDPSGQIPDFDLIADLSHRSVYQRLDILINCPSTTIKRVANCSKCSENRRLKDYIDSIDKKYWIIREPHAKQQWAFLIGSNWDNFPVFKGLGFHKLGTSEGNALFSLLNNTAKEREAM